MLYKSLSKVLFKETIVSEGKDGAVATYGKLRARVNNLREDHPEWDCMRWDVGVMTDHTGTSRYSILITNPKSFRPSINVALMVSSFLICFMAYRHWKGMS